MVWDCLQETFVLLQQQNFVKLTGLALIMVALVTVHKIFNIELEMRGKA